MDKIANILNLDAFPLDRPDSTACQALVQRCQNDLETTGMFNLERLMHASAAQAAADALGPRVATQAFTHKRRHNIYFRRNLPDLSPDHPARAEFETVNHTLCGDQLGETAVLALYHWQPLIDFLARVIGKPALYPMDDPLACTNVMSYGPGEALNWHFDRSEFTTTLLLQAPEAGGEFLYCRNLRSATDPNYDGVARLLSGDETGTQAMSVTPGTLNVFRGVNTAHRTRPVQGSRPRLIAVFSYFDRAGVRFTPNEQIGFYGRSA